MSNDLERVGDSSCRLGHGGSAFGIGNWVNRRSYELGNSLSDLGRFLLGIRAPADSAIGVVDSFQNTTTEVGEGAQACVSSSKVGDSPIDVEPRANVGEWLAPEVRASKVC